MYKRQLLNVVPELFERQWLITGKGIPFRPPTDMEVDIKTEPDLIELEVTVHFDDLKVGLPALISAIKDDSRWVTLGKGQIGVLPFEWLEKNAPWLEMGELRGEKLIFRKNQSPVIDSLLAENIQSKLDDGFKAERERLAGFKGIEPCSPSEDFVGELRAYQEEGLGWLRFLDQMAWGGCLADDMGLGKTCLLYTSPSPRD